MNELDKGEDGKTKSVALGVLGVRVPSESVIERVSKSPLDLKESASSGLYGDTLSYAYLDRSCADESAGNTPFWFLWNSSKRGPDNSAKVDGEKRSEVCLGGGDNA